MRKLYLAAIVLTFALAGASTNALGQDKSEATEASFTLISPKVGDVLRAGQRVEIKWNMTLDEIIVNNEWAEMELVLETAEGVSMRISPQMNVTVRSAFWTVPNLRTESARIVMQCGIEGQGDQYRFVQPGTFTIRPAKTNNPAIVVELPVREAKAGSDLDISWTSTLDRGASYEVMVSYDHGAHFYKAGATSENRFSLHIDDRLAGSMMVQVIGRGVNGSPVESIADRNSTVRIIDKQD
ncbi:MAG: hypothetical protein ABIV21_04615 [Pyrinomonadaceae bacterium]